MADQYNLKLDQLKMHAPQSPLLAFRPVDRGAPQQDWCAHLQNFPLYRRELEEFSVLGEVVVRIADGTEPAPLERVKILSLEYAVKTLSDETDGREFVRSVKAIAGPDASSFELEQLAAFYYGEIRRRGGASEVLTEMGLLGMQMEAVTATINEREIDFSETEVPGQAFSVADQRRIEKARGKQAPLPPETPNFDDEMSFVLHRIGSSKITKTLRDEFAEYYLSDGNKTVEELDAGFTSFERLEQYDENGLLGFSMNDGQHPVVVYELGGEVDPSYLPDHARPLAKEMSLIFVGHAIGGAAAQKARRFTLASRILQQSLKTMPKDASRSFSTPVEAVDKFSALPFTNEEFNDWLAFRLEELYPHRALRSVRRLMTGKAGRLFEYPAAQEVNPDFEEMQYVSSVCQILWNQMHADFHLRSLRRARYQDLFLRIRSCLDTADLARLKQQAYGDLKEHKKLTLKEFTALNTAAKSQEARLAGKTSPGARKTLLAIDAASLNRLRYLKYFLYNDPQIKTLTRQEKQRLWKAVRDRETALKAALGQGISESRQTVQPSLFRCGQNTDKQVVRIVPRGV
jgi:hypothetical protein